MHLANDLLINKEADHLVGALLQHAFQGELDPKEYTEFSEPALDKDGKTRLFVGFGKSSGLTRRKLVNIIVEQCQVSPDKIHDLMIRDKFAFIMLILLIWFLNKFSMEREGARVMWS